MTFKNQKEEVIEIELTSYGKHLLSKGKFRPTFYAFFDDDVLYDAEYGGEAEEQNYAQTRILEETPRLRVQTTYTGLETEIEKQIEEARAGNKNSKEAYQATKEKHYALSAPLGNSSISSDYAPSWDVTLHGGEFESQLIVKSGDHQTSRIPQMNLKDIVYEPEVTEAEEEEYYKSQPVFDTATYRNGNAISIEDSDVILEIDELHTDSLRENYDIEFFIVEEKVIDNKTVENLIPLSFIKESSGNIVDGLLVEEQEYSEPEIDETYVEYYFDLEFDQNIDKQRLCKLGYVTDFSKRGFIKINCVNGVSVETEMDNVYRNLETGQPVIGDDC